MLYEEEQIAQQLKWRLQSDQDFYMNFEGNEVTCGGLMMNTFYTNKDLSLSTLDSNPISKRSKQKSLSNTDFFKQIKTPLTLCRKDMFLSEKFTEFLNFNEKKITDSE